MKIGVVGCRHCVNYNYIKSKLDLFIQNNDKFISSTSDSAVQSSAAAAANTVARNITIISGGAKGVDKLAKDYATEMGYFYLEHAPKVEEHGSFNAAAHARNKQIAIDCDVLIAFPSETSIGTWDTITRAKNLCKPVYIYEV